MTPTIILSFLTGYFALLFVVSWVTGRNADNAAYFIGNRKSPWYLVAFGMIGASLSGVTFISVPGWVGANQFAYMQMVLGYLFGYAFIALVLMPLYYRLNLTSIYGYLEERFGKMAYKTGAAFFLISRVVGASFRLFLVAIVLQEFVFKTWNIPFWIPVALTILLIWVYTFRGGIKTIVWTDSLQTLFMLLSVGTAIVLIAGELNLTFGSLISAVSESEYSKIFFLENWKDVKFLPKQLLFGAFIAIVMTGLDQDMMQKNLSCKNIGEAQKNMFWFSAILVVVNLVFLSLGALLYLFCESKGIAIPPRSDHIFPEVALQHLPVAAGAIFIIGLAAAAYSSADSALTALTTSFCVDFLGMKEKGENHSQQTRYGVQVAFSVVLFLVILSFEALDNQAIIGKIFQFAGYTYGPLLGLYAFGLFSKRKVFDNATPFIAVTSVLLSVALWYFSPKLFNGYNIGFEILMINGAITYIGLLIFSRKNKD